MDEQPEVQLAVKKQKIKQIDGPGMFWLLIILTLLLLAISVGIFSKSNGGAAIESPTITPEPSESRITRIYTVSYKNGVFSPTNLRIHSGDTVKFKNDDFSAIRVITGPHPEHNNLVGFDSVGDIPQGSFFSFTFAAKGTFDYHNEKNVKESGTIIVR
jgi:plastocyanin